MSSITPKAYLIYVQSLDSAPRVRFVSDTKGFTSNIKEAKLMTSDEAYEAYNRLNIYYRPNVIETTRPEFAELKWDIQDNCPVDEITHLDILSNPEEELKPKTYNWVIHYDNKFFYAELGEEYVYSVEVFLPDVDDAYIFRNLTQAEAEAKLAQFQTDYPKVNLKISIHQ